ncbi:MAG: PQQ-like beta-propeller repeat protein [Alphaproteobacteria bacterium]|nr:PQQ-like beta-propeller repeat protein [Alphaproteobacteria bacterium]
MLKKIIIFCVLCITVAGCTKHDPILSGTRYSVFNTETINVLNKDITDLPDEYSYKTQDCPYKQDETNSVWYGDKKIYTGFAPDKFVKNSQSPVCDGDYLYTGFSTGEVVKLNTKTNVVDWTIDVFKTNSLLGGSPVVDIVAHVVLDTNYIYVGGLGDSFCKINKTNGAKKWCLDISVAKDFIMVNNTLFVVGTDNNLYAINKVDGSVYWKTNISEQESPIYKNKTIIIDNQKINAVNGKLI